MNDLTKRLLFYSRNVLSGKPLTCKKHKWACQRFINDLERAGTDDFPYEFIPEKAIRFIEWCLLYKHTKGILVGRHIDLYHTPVLLFIACNIYGWYHIKTGYRRFNKLFWEVARKNAKSQTLALIATYELMAFDESGDEVNEVYCAATKREQAKIVYKEAIYMLKRCSEMAPYYTIVNNEIKHLKTDSFMRALSEEDKKTGDGLNPQCGIIDEYHAHDTSEMYDIIDSGMGARRQPLLAIITTAGFNLDHPCYRVEYQLAGKILNPDVPLAMENYFVLINELDRDEKGELVDDIKDPEVWVKSNPIIASYPEGRKYLKDRLEEALEIPEKMRNFLTKHLNIWVHLTELAYMNMVKWSNCYLDPLPDLKGLSVWIGIDFSSKIDLTSMSFEFKIGDDYIVLSHSFIASETFEHKRKTDKVPYGLWAEQGWLTVQEGPVVDYVQAIEYGKELVRENGWFVEAWCLDPWCASQIMKDLVDEGEEVIEIRQGAKTLSEPTKDFRDMVLLGRVKHDGNPLLAWAISNAVAEEVDKNENIMLNKRKSQGRIDPIASLINAHVRCMVADEYSEPNITFI